MSTDVFFRFRWPDGTFNASAPLLAEFYEAGRLMNWQGSPVWCPARSSIGFEVNNATVSVQSLVIVLAGFQRVYEGPAAAPAGAACGFPSDSRRYRDLPFWLSQGVSVSASTFRSDGVISVREHPFAVLGIAVLGAAVAEEPS